MKGEGNQKVMLSPFNAALDISVKTIHPWNLMKRICVQLVESYGDNSIDFEEDSFTRLTIAVKYLVTAIKINNQSRLLSSNSVTLSNDDSFGTTPPQDLLQIILTTFSSSSTIDFNDASKVTSHNTSRPTTGKGGAPKAAAKGMPAGNAGVASASISGRDAILLFSSLQREVDHFWSDGFEQNISSDIHFYLKSAYPVYKSKCTLEKLPDVTEQITVPISAVSTLWNPIRQSENFISTSQTVNNGLDYTINGAYTHMSVYFVLGDKASIPVVPIVVPTGKGNAKPDPNANVVVTSKEPVLTKIVLPRTDLYFIEKKIRALRDKLLDAQSKKLNSLITNYNEESITLIVMFIDLLRTGIIVFDTSKYDGKLETNDYKVKIIPDTSNNTFNLEIISNITSNVVTIALNDKILLNISNTICPEMSMDFLIDNDLCSIIRMGLGYN